MDDKKEKSSLVFPDEFQEHTIKLLTDLQKRLRMLELKIKILENRLGG